MISLVAIAAVILWQGPIYDFGEKHTVRVVSINHYKEASTDLEIEVEEQQGLDSMGQQIWEPCIGSGTERIALKKVIVNQLEKK